MSNAVVSARTNEALIEVMRFFGIDEYNRPLFGEAARDAGGEAFERTITALAAACLRDSRNGITHRVRTAAGRAKRGA